MKKQKNHILYKGYLAYAAEGGGESLPVLNASGFYKGENNYQNKNDLGLHANGGLTINLGNNRYKLYVATSIRESINSDQHQELITKLQNDDKILLKDWAFKGALDLTNPAHSTCFNTFCENKVVAFLLCRGFAPGHPKGEIPIL